MSLVVYGFKIKYLKLLMADTLKLFAPSGNPRCV